MKRIISILVLLISFYSSFSQQFVAPRSSPYITVQDSRLRALYNFYLPHLHGINLNGGLDTLGMVFYEDSSGHVWYRDTIPAGGHQSRMILRAGDGVSGVSSFNTRTGIVTLSSGDVVTALGYTPVNPNGTSFQYIAGDGSKVTFPTIPAQINITDAGLFSHSGTYPNYTFNASTPTQQQVFSSGSTLTQNNFWVTGANVLGITGTSAFGLPTGSTSQRPSSPGAGYFRYNTDSSATEFWNGSQWVKTGTGTGVTGVTSFNTRTGSVTLSSGDVTSALGFNPYNSSNPSGYISNITGLVQAGANINITGSGTSGSPYVIVGTGSGGGGITQLNGDVIAGPGSGNVSASLATVTSNTGSFGNAANVAQLSFDGKGRQLTAANIPIQIAEAQVTNLTSDLASKLSNITGLITTGAGYTLNGSGTTGSPYSLNISFPIFNQDSIKHKFVDTGTIARNLYTIAWDSINRKWILTAPGTGGGGSGTVTNFTFTNGNGFTGTVTNPTTTPTLSLAPSFTGLTFSNGSAFAAATISAPLTYSAGTLGIQVANTSQNGYLSSTDWNTFNGKQSALSFNNGITNTSGTVQLGGPLIQNTTLGTAGFNLSLTGLPSKATALATDSVYLIDNVGKSWKLPVPAGGASADTGITVSNGLSITRLASVRNIASDSLIQSKKIDLNRFPVIRERYSAQGIVATGTTLTNYPISSLDSNNYYFSSTAYLTTGNKLGGVLWNSALGDSMLVSAPFGIVCGSSYSEGHVSLGSRLQPISGVYYNYKYADTTGQLSYFFRQLTGYRWYNQAIGGQTSTQMRNRWARDVLGQTISITLDGISPATISRTPYIVFYDGIGNDAATAGFTPAISEANLIYFAASCQDNGIKLIICNSPAGAPTQAQYNYCTTVNRWLASGALDKYGVVVYDLAKKFSNPLWGYDGVHANPNLIGSDSVHFTKAGYDSLSRDVVATCRIPILTKVIITNKLAPYNPIANFNYTSGLTIDGQAYAMSKPTDTINITSPFGNRADIAYDAGDSIWVKATALTNVVGNTTTYGYGHIDWVMDNTNNGTDTAYYTRKTQQSLGSSAATMDMTRLTITPDNNISTSPEFVVRANDNNGYAASILATGGGPRMIIGNSLTPIGTSFLTNYGDYGSNGSVVATGTGSRLGNLNLGNTGGPFSTGTGIGVFLNSGIYYMDFEVGSSSNVNHSLYEFNSSQTATPAFTVPSTKAGIIHTLTGWGNTSNADTLGTFYSQPTLNSTAITTPGVMGGFIYDPTVTSIGTNTHIGFWNTLGQNRFNTISGMTVIGTNAPHGSAKLDVTSRDRGFLPPRMTTGARDSIGYIKSITVTAGGTGYSTLPTVAISGGTGSGATAAAIIPTGTSVGSILVLDGGIDYNPSSPVTVTISGGGGTGATATATISGPDSGLVIFNTTTSNLQYFNGVSWVNGGGAVSSVSNLDGTLTISPTTGAVVASLALGHANTWTGVQTQPAPIFTGMTSAGANDSVVTVDPVTGQTHRRSGVFNLFFANALTSAAGDSVYQGGPLNQNTTIGTAGFSYSITGLPSKATALATDSVLLNDIAGKIWKFPIPPTPKAFGSFGTVTSTGSVALASNDIQDVVYIDATSGNITTTVFFTANPQYLNIKRKDSGANTVTIQLNTGNIDGVASKTISALGSLKLVYDGTNAWIL